MASQRIPFFFKIFIYVHFNDNDDYDDDDDDDYDDYDDASFYFRSSYVMQFIMAVQMNFVYFFELSYT